MDALVRQTPSLKKHLKDARDVVHGHIILGIGPNGEVEELTIRGTLFAGKKLHGSLIDPTKPESKIILEKFAADCDQISRLKHPNVAAFYGLCLSENMQDSSKSLTLIREYAKDDLTNLLEANPCLPWAVKTTILLDVTRALDYLHMNKPVIVHRNLTSTNVLITDSMKAKVADMVCTCFYNVNRKLEKKKLAYMSPEAVKTWPTPKFETASDMFSFGHVALHVAIHMLPGDLSKGSTEIEKRQQYITHLRDPQGVDKILYDLIMSCLHDSPRKRPTASTAMRELKTLDEKLACKGEHKALKRLTMYEQLFEHNDEADSSPTQSALNIGTTEEEQSRSRQFQTTQIREGVPSVLFLKETVKEGSLVNRRNTLKWMEYKFEISAKHFLQYSKLNGQVLKQMSLDEVTDVKAYVRAGDVYPFCVRFRPNVCWSLGAHNEEERKVWMEAVLPGSTHDQYFVDDHSSNLHKPLCRSSTSPTLFHSPSDPAYVKYSEINVPAANNKPPPVPERPADTIKLVDNTYLPLLPSSPEATEVDERMEAIEGFTLEQLYEMVEMFEKKAPPVSPRKARTRGYSESAATAAKPSKAGVTIRNSRVDVNEGSNKHQSKGLYVCFADIMTTEVPAEKESINEVFSETPPKDTSALLKPRQETKQPLSPKKSLNRQNAVRNSRSSRKVDEIKEKPSVPVKAVQGRLRKILRQQSSDDMLESADNPEWSKADLGDEKGTTHVQSTLAVVAVGTASINSLTIATKDLRELTNIAPGHYGLVYRAKFTDTSQSEDSEPISVTVKSCQDQTLESTEFLEDIAVLSSSKHKNIVEYFGVVPENKWLVMEYSPVGDLKSYLKDTRVSACHLIKYMLDIAMGMHHIAEQRLVHRNLALRNVLIMEDDTCKVTDLGVRNRSFSVSSFDLAHEVSPHTDQRRWMSPENLTRGQFSEASDVWSFGVVQWEMFQPSRYPYSALSSSQFPQHIQRGHQLDIPDVCHDIVARIMRACWHWNTTRRPSFMYIASLLMKRTLGGVD